jgi:hypothetical protein
MLLGQRKGREIPAGNFDPVPCVNGATGERDCHAANTPSIYVTPRIDMLTRLFAFCLVLAGVALGAFGLFLFVTSTTVFREILAAVFCVGGLIVLVNGLMWDSLFATIRKVEQRVVEQSGNVSLTVRAEAAKLVANSVRARVDAAPPAAITPRAAEPQIEYFYADTQGNENGPHNRTTMRRLAQLQQIIPETPVYRSDSSSWLTLADFPELAS